MQSDTAYMIRVFGSVIRLGVANNSSSSLLIQVSNSVYVLNLSHNRLNFVGISDIM